MFDYRCLITLHDYNFVIICLKLFIISVFFIYFTAASLSDFLDVT